MSTPEATTTPPAAEVAPEEAAPGMIAKVKMSLSDYAAKYELDKKYEAVVAYEEEKKAATIETYESLKASTLEKLEATKAAINEKVVEPYVAPAAEYVAETASATDAKVRETAAATTKYTYDTTLTAYENVASFLFKMQCALGSRTKPAPEETAAEDEPAAEPAAVAAV